MVKIGIIATSKNYALKFSNRAKNGTIRFSLLRRIFCCAETHVLDEKNFFFRCNVKNRFFRGVEVSIFGPYRAILTKICWLTQLFKFYRIACPLIGENQKKWGGVRGVLGCALKKNVFFKIYPWKWEGVQHILAIWKA